MTYAEQLLDPRWKEKRAWIIAQNLNMCFKCGETRGLEVHHKKYIDGLMAWEYEDYLLIPLCRNCHALEHGIFPFNTKVKSIKEILLDHAKKVHRH